jgi:mRNA interferase MazF
MIKHKIVLVPFPFDDLSATKVRPAVCLTDAIGLHQHLIIAFITSRVPSTPLPADIVINSNSADFAATGLRVSSTIQLHRLITVTQSFIQRELGTLSLRLQNEVSQRLKSLFGL